VGVPVKGEGVFVETAVEELVTGLEGGLARFRVSPSCSDLLWLMDGSANLFGSLPTGFLWTVRDAEGVVGRDSKENNG
jgi:hypothetical protein